MSRAGLAALAAIVAFLWLNSVSTAITEADRVALVTMVGADVPKLQTFDEQVEAIQSVQHKVIAASPLEVGIPLSRPREPQDLLAARGGICFDRSRSIEKALALLGFQVRHVSMFEDTDRGVWSALTTLAHAGGPSHAATEVLTERGWMLVDPISEWIGLTSDGRVVSADLLRTNPSLEHAAWDSRVAGRPYPWVLQRQFIDVPGLYSRHGGFYWPFLPFPDVNWTQLVGWVLTG